MSSSWFRFAVLSSCLAVAFACLTQAACDDGSAVKEAAPDAGRGPNPTEGGADGPPVDGGDAAISDCFTNPTTHLEIINACTTAVKVTKNPVLTKLTPDGGLPPTN